MRELENYVASWCFNVFHQPSDDQIPMKPSSSNSRDQIAGCDSPLHSGFQGGQKTSHLHTRKQCHFLARLYLGCSPAFRQVQDGVSFHAAATLYVSGVEAAESMKWVNGHTCLVNGQQPPESCMGGLVISR